MARFAIETLPDTVEGQKAALRRLANLVVRGSIDPRVVRAARAIVGQCEARDDLCELEAIFHGVRDGTDAVPALRKGLRYVSDPRAADYFTGPARLLEECAQGACSADCDESATLVATLAAALGFKAGVRAWGPASGREGFTHVYAVAAYPKKGPWPKGYAGHGMDVTISYSSVGWEPKRGRVLTLWVE